MEGRDQFYYDLASSCLPPQQGGGFLIRLGLWMLVPLLSWNGSNRSLHQFIKLLYVNIKFVKINKWNQMKIHIYTFKVYSTFSFKWFIFVPLSIILFYHQFILCNVRHNEFACDKFQPLFLSESRLSGQNMSLWGWPLVANLSNVRPVSVQVLKKQKMPVWDWVKMQ